MFFTIVVNLKELYWQETVAPSSNFQSFLPIFFLFDSKHSMRTASIQNNSLRNTPSTRLKLTTMVFFTNEHDAHPAHSKTKYKFIFHLAFQYRWLTQLLHHLRKAHLPNKIPHTFQSIAFQHNLFRHGHCQRLFHILHQSARYFFCQQRSH